MLDRLRQESEAENAQRRREVEGQVEAERARAEEKMTNFRLVESR